LNVALADHQALLYGQLQSAYDDLRRTQQNVMQQERLRALGQMAGGVAHDINNAIVPIGLHAELLLKNPSVNAQGVEHLKIIQRAIADVAQTVTRMGQFYRQRDSATELVAVSLNPLVEQVLELTRVRWSDMSQHRGALIQVVTDLSPDAPPIRGVEGEIRDALINLVFNAVDAMPGGGTLTLRTRVERAAGAEERVIVEVSDTGNGMDEETRKRCLEPFFTTKGERGTGLGLAMVYGVAQRHGAELEVESAPGKGTTMRLRFRPAPQTPKAVSPAVQAEAPRGLRPPRRDVRRRREGPRGLPDRRRHA
jgi:signal transduction histidine kinase